MAMKYPKPKSNPKSEGRNPKEIRDPKSETDAFAEVGKNSSGFWTWGDGTKGSVYLEGQKGTEILLLREEPEGRKPAPDLQERTAVFGEAIIEFAKQIPRTPVNDRLISQLTGAGTSVGANYCEADDSVSSKEFKQKIGTCRKESKETMFFLRMVAKSEPSLAPKARQLWREAKELNLIFGSIWRK
ncbi:MAG TPA: four helix bundle protein [Verrucomicrobiae bacterium]